MKLLADQAKEILSDLLGEDVEVVADNGDVTDTSEIITTAKSTLRSDVEKEILSDAETEAKFNGKFMTILRSQVHRTLGIPKSETEKKSLSEIIPIIKDKLANSTLAEKDDWKAKYDALLADSDIEKERLQTEWETRYNTDILLERKKFIDRDINDSFVSLVNKLPRQGGDAVKQAKVLRNLAETEGFEVRFENGALELWKDNKKQKTEEIINTLAKDVLPLAKDTSHIKPSDVKAGLTPEGKVVENTNPKLAGFEHLVAQVNTDAA